MSERFLITGALGCIGAWAARILVREEVPVVSFDSGSSRHRLELIMSHEEIDSIEFIEGDITDVASLAETLDAHEITNVVHLAALQVPFVRDDPPLGARVNVLGTVNMFEAVTTRRDRIDGIAYASSAGVYGPSDGPRVEEETPGHPGTLYGVFKQANEGTAQIYWQDEGIPSVGLRPAFVYGPGRDTGLTSEPTLAMEAATRGQEFHMSFGGTNQFDYAPDVAAAFVQASREIDQGARVHNLGGSSHPMSEVVSLIEAAAPEARGKITFDDRQLPFPEEFGSTLPLGTSLETGIRETIELFRGS